MPDERSLGSVRGVRARSGSGDNRCGPYSAPAHSPSDRGARESLSPVPASDAFAVSVLTLGNSLALRRNHRHGHRPDEEHRRVVQHGELAVPLRYVAARRGNAVAHQPPTDAPELRQLGAAVEVWRLRLGAHIAEAERSHLVRELVSPVRIRAARLDDIEDALTQVTPRCAVERAHRMSVRLLQEERASWPQRGDELFEHELALRNMQESPPAVDEVESGLGQLRFEYVLLPNLEVRIS